MALQRLTPMRVFTGTDVFTIPRRLDMSDQVYIHVNFDPDTVTTPGNGFACSVRDPDTLDVVCTVTWDSGPTAVDDDGVPFTFGVYTFNGPTIAAIAEPECVVEWVGAPRLEVFYERGD
jgi:hypothetical protein